MQRLVVAVVLSLLGSAVCSASAPDAPKPILFFAALGDAEPKPDPVFPGLAAAINDINLLAQHKDLEFVIGVGDIAHKGTLVQYEAASRELERLLPPFYPIMGNEEHGSSVDRFLDYARRWNQELAGLDTPRYVLEFDRLALVMASPDHSRQFTDSGVSWIRRQLERLAPKPAMLVVHGAQTGVYPENPDKGVTHPDFLQVIRQANLIAVVSGDLHMDMQRVEHSKQIGQVHYLHIPGLERTKIPDGSQHTPMFRTFALYDDGMLTVDTFVANGTLQPLREHRYSLAVEPWCNGDEACIRRQRGTDPSHHP